MTAEQPDDPVIRTPDQRLRVFVSSTLGELAQERQSVSGAITTLRLIPVMFELGARPYPPRDLYRAYVAQSDVFIGLYWQRYGWVGPGMEISGLEDELELARGLPRLLYVKAPAPDRDARLTDLLDGIEAEAFESYRSFRTPRELARLVRDDLATLLSERFAATRRDAVSTPRSVRSPGSRLPVSTTSLLGREQDIDAVAGLVRGPDARLVTLTGPGGVGKTRLAVAVAERVRDRFEAGTAFVPLASVTRPEQVVGSIARAVGADLRGAGAPVQALVEQLGEGAWLLILDNVEQVVGAAGDLGELLSRSRGVTLLATSRTVLGLRGEREYPVAPLPLAADLDGMPIDELATSPAVALFVDRARAIRPDFTLTGANARAVVGICRRVEGMPLAIELAAARTRLLEPAAILRRLSASLDALGKGGTDLPERQRTLRATVDWSVGLLDDSERSLLETMAVFVDGWTIEAAADVAELEENGVLELTEALARHSLVQLDRTEFGRPRMLETVREFIAERLAARPDVADVQRRHAHYFAAFAEQADRPLRGIGHNAWLDRLEPEAGNLAVAAGWYMVHERSRLPHLFRVLWLFWELRDHVGEARATVDELLPTAESLDPQSRAELLWTAVANAAEVGDDQAALSASQQLAPLLEQIADPFLRAVSQLAISWTAPIRGDISPEPSDERRPPWRSFVARTSRTGRRSPPSAPAPWRWPSTATRTPQVICGRRMSLGSSTTTSGWSPGR